MRQAALIVLIAHIGCYVPAKTLTCGSGRQDFYPDWRLSDDLAGGRSTFDGGDVGNCQYTP